MVVCPEATFVVNFPILHELARNWQEITLLAAAIIGLAIFARGFMNEQRTSAIVGVMLFVVAAGMYLAFFSIAQPSCDQFITYITPGEAEQQLESQGSLSVIVGPDILIRSEDPVTCYGTECYRYRIDHRGIKVVAEGQNRLYLVDCEDVAAFDRSYLGEGFCTDPVLSACTHPEMIALRNQYC